MQKISLILPTLNNSENIFFFLNSIFKSDKIKATIEIIIIDQSKSNNTKKICLEFNQKFNNSIIYKRSKHEGISANRNIGLQIATGDIIGFPDDDCIYYPDTLKKVSTYFSNPKYGYYDAILGQVYDKNKNQPLIKKWPKYNSQVSTLNFYKLSSSITIFTKRNNINFNEQMGVGTQYGSCEDVDFIYNMLISGKKIFYISDIKVWHAEINNNKVSLKRVESYASGLGYFISHDTSSTKIGLLCGCIIIKCIQLILYFNRYRRGYFFYYFKGLIRGIQKR